MTQGTTVSSTILSTNITATTFTGNLTGNASSANNLAGGTASQLPYQSAAGTTSFITNGTSGQVLTSSGASAPTWTSTSIGSTANTIALRDGSANITANAFNATSDYRIKENVVKLDETFTTDALNPVFYRHIESQQYNIGFLAHELQEVYPYLVTGEKDGPTTQSVNYSGLIGVLVKEIQELKREIQALKVRTQLLESINKIE